jgi:predicted nucleic acid-binding protein
VTADSSVLVAAVATWNTRHRDARTAIRDVDALVAHAELEAYSVLTRLPEPFRLSASDAAEYLNAQFRGERLVLGAQARHGLVERLADAGIMGGRVYDALIALTAQAHDLPLLTCDTRAETTYRALGVAVRPI